jgi:V8-like Glu-specific endopeptidase
VIGVSGFVKRAAPAILLLSALLAPAAVAAEAYRVPSRDPAPKHGSDPVAIAGSLRVGDASEVGDRTNGRVFGVDPRLGPYSCSGTALNTPSRSIVLTAGHCVVDDGSWGRDLVFAPAYDHGNRPFGTFEATSVFVTPQWRRWENSAFDVAALLVKPNELGALTDVVGGRGYETGKSRFAAFQIFGYPAGALAGEELRDCQTHGLGSDLLSNRLYGPPTVPSICDMAGGSSGGAWIVDGEYVDGITSYGYTNNFTHLYSPYFGAAIGNFLHHLP